MNERELPVWPWTASVVLGLIGAPVFGYFMLLEGWVAVTPLPLSEVERAQRFADSCGAALIFCLLAVCLGVFRLIRIAKSEKRSAE